ncbi:MAG: diguanylate cyclase [Anaerolineales bacterium]
MRNVVVYTLMFSAMLQLLMAAYAWSRRNEPAAKSFIMVCFIGFVWAFMYAIEMASGDIHIKILSLQIAWAVVSFGPLALLFLVLHHLELIHLITRWRLVFLLIPTFLMIVLVWTYPLHNLFLYGYTIKQVGALEILQKKTGILYMPIMLVFQGISLITYYFLIRSLASTNRIKRQQSLAILFAQFILFIVNGMSIIDISPIKGFDFTPHALVISSGLYAFAIFRYRWLDIIPLARNTLVEVLPAGVVVIDEKNRIVDINPSARDHLQVADSIVGQETQVAFPHLDTIFQPQTSADSLKKEFNVKMPKGQHELFEAHMMSLKDQAGQFKGRIILFHDITERKQAEVAIQQANERLQEQLIEIELLHAQLREQAIRDSLTGLYNRRYLDEALEKEAQRAIRKEHPLSLVMIDVDNFKNINDSFGHKAGDLVLQKIGELIQNNIRPSDIACRYGGDEFTLILPETTYTSAQKCVERLRKDVSLINLQFNDQNINNIKITIGISVFPEDGATGSQALQAADNAMYHVKQVKDQ